MAVAVAWRQQRRAIPMATFEPMMPRVVLSLAGLASGKVLVELTVTESAVPRANIRIVKKSLRSATGKAARCDHAAGPSNRLWWTASRRPSCPRDRACDQLRRAAMVPHTRSSPLAMAALLSTATWAAEPALCLTSAYCAVNHPGAITEEMARPTLSCRRCPALAAGLRQGVICRPWLRGGAEKYGQATATSPTPSHRWPAPVAAPAGALTRAQLLHGGGETCWFINTMKGGFANPASPTPHAYITWPTPMCAQAVPAPFRRWTTRSSLRGAESAPMAMAPPTTSWKRAEAGHQC